MPCSLQVYRAYIGTFFPKPYRKSRVVTGTSSSSCLAIFILVTQYGGIIVIIDIQIGRNCGEESGNWNNNLVDNQFRICPWKVSVLTLPWRGGGLPKPPPSVNSDCS